jgi:Na+/H+-dicarboxylate symporter
MKKKRPLTIYILAAMLLGILVGYACHEIPDKKLTIDIASNISIATDVFLRLIKMIIALLVFSTLTVGIAHMGDGKTAGRIGMKAFCWFVVASLVSLALGMVLSNYMQLGTNLGLPLPEIGTSTNLKTAAFTLKDFITHLVPKSPIEAMANNEILQVLVFSIFFGAALAGLGEAGKALTAVVDQLAQVMLRITGAIMTLAPLAVFAAMASVVTTQGLGVLLTFAKFMGGFYLGLFCLWVLLIGAGFVVMGPRVFKLVGLIREPFLLAFSTASSEAAYPKLLVALDQFGVQRKISSFVLPMGYSFNLDGSMMYCTFAVLFIAQAYGIDLPLGTQITMLLLLMLTSKGMAGVPRASLVVIAATLNQFNIPEAGLLLLMGVDQFLDMGRSATNAVGNAVATAVVAKWEGGLSSEEDAPYNNINPEANTHWSDEQLARKAA